MCKMCLIRQSEKVKPMNQCEQNGFTAPGGSAFFLPSAKLGVSHFKRFIFLEKQTG